MLQKFIFVEFFIIIIQKYELLKKHFYELRLDGIRGMIKRADRLRYEVANIVYLSMLTNIACLYFLSLTTPNQIFSRIPGFEGTQVLGDDFTTKLFSFELFSTIARLDYFLPFTVLGTIIVLSLKFIHRKRLANNQKGVPGSIPLLGFLYAMLGIGISQIIFVGFRILEIGFSINDLVLLLILVFLFSLFGIPSSILATIVDRFLLSKTNSSTYR